MAAVYIIMGAYLDWLPELWDEGAWVHWALGPWALCHLFKGAFFISGCLGLIVALSMRCGMRPIHPVRDAEE